MVSQKLVKEIIPSPHNPRKKLSPEDEEYNQIKSSIERFGYVEPLVVNSVNNHCISGNNRLTVLQDMGIEDIQCFVIDEPSKEREIALTIAINKIKGKWDYAKLEKLLNSYDDEEISLTGFSSAELDELFGDFKSFIPEETYHSKEKDIDEPEDEINVSCKIGNYSFFLPASIYKKLLTDIRLSVGFDNKAVCKELRRRILKNEAC
jgi:hypothetical protein